MEEAKKNKKDDKFLMFVDKIKKANAKSVAKKTTLFFGILMIIIMSVTSFAIDDDFKFVVWISGALIIAACCVFGLFMGESMGKDKHMGNPNGLYQTAIANYNKFFNYIEKKLCYFAQWFNWFMPQELENKKVRFLIERGVDTAKARKIVKYCHIDDVDSLKTHPIKVQDENGKDILIGRIEEYQYDAVKYVLSGEIKLDSCSSAYYLTATGKSTNKSVLERGNQLDKEIKFNRIANRTKKIVFSLGISLILGLFAVEQIIGSGSAQDNWQAVMNLLTRLTALSTSYISGWSSAITEVRLLSEKIDNKVVVLRLFNFGLVTREFKPLNDDELVKKQYEKWEKEEEEAKKRVMDPTKNPDKVEIVQEKDIKKLDNKSHQISMR